MPVRALTGRMAPRLSALEAQGQMRTLTCVLGINFCSNDYLALSDHPLLRDAVREGLEQCERVGATFLFSSRRRHTIWDELEDTFAAYAGTEAALFFNSGYAAN